MKKKILCSILALFICFTLVGCGSNESNNGGSYNGATKGAGDSLENVTSKNYKKVAKEVFGLEIKEENTWTLKEAESPNGVNNLNVEYTATTTENPKGVIESYFNACLALGDIYSYGINEAATGMVKKDKFTDFSTFAEGELTSIGNLTQTMWIYTYKDTSVLFSISMQDGSASLAFVLLG